MKHRPGILTGGGHISTFHAGMDGILAVCPEAVGFIDGYEGLHERKYVTLKRKDIPTYRAGSMLGCTRGKVDIEKAKEAMLDAEVDSLIVMGGDDHLGEAAKLAEAGVNVYGWPKTMDNDLSRTAFTAGYITAAKNAARVIRNAYNCAMTNRKAVLIPMFGRNADWVVAAAGMWGGAPLIVPGEKYVEGGDEERYSIEQIYAKVQEEYETNRATYGRPFAVVPVSEGADISGLDSHLREDEVDEHNNPKIEPMKLALVLKDAFNEIGGSDMPVAIDCITYDAMRNCDPDSSDLRLSYNAGVRVAKAARDLEPSGCVIFRQNKVFEDLAPLSEVSETRFLRPEGFIDYDTMTVDPSFGNCYKLLFGPPVEKDELVYDILKR